MIDIGADLQRAFDEGYEKGKSEGAKPVRHGKWENAIDNTEYKACSLCGWVHDVLSYGNNYCPNCGAKMEIINAPTVDVVPKMGEWIEVEVLPEVYDIGGVKTWGSKIQCDQCGFRFMAIEGRITQYNYCPNCGAKMDGGGRTK